MCPLAPRSTAKATGHLVDQAVHFAVRIVESAAKSSATLEPAQTHLSYLLLFVALPPLRAVAGQVSVAQILFPRRRYCEQSLTRGICPAALGGDCVIRRLRASSKS